jgi:putative ABC transport system permease protein
MNDAVDRLADIGFEQTARQDATLMLARDLPLRAVQDARSLPGVLAAEAQLTQPAILRNGTRFRRLAIEARPPGTDLARTVDATGRPVALPPSGLLLSARLAEKLGVGPGDTVQAEFLTGRRETHALRVAGLIEQPIGLGAYMDADALAALRREGPRVSAIHVAVDPARAAAFDTALAGLPALAGTALVAEARQSFRDTIAENVGIMNAVYVVLAVLITFGVTYNGARILLSERARDLAGLRILGFTRAEVSGILMGETLVLALLAQPLGWAIGAWLTAAVTGGMESDIYAIPVVLLPSTFAQASLVVLGAAVGSALVVRRRLDRLDLIAVLKTRE